jgi:tetratricopeptide (TPR) repeat protein
VLASHYLAAVEAAPEADDAPAVRAKAGEMLARAGDRAGSLGAPGEGQRYYDRAADLAEEPLAAAALLELAGRLATQANRSLEARERLERAISLFAEAGDERGAARASAGLADVDVGEGRLDEAAARLEGAVARLGQGEPSVELAAALAQLGRARLLAGRWDSAAAAVERALTLAERLQLPEVFVEALTTKGTGLLTQGRPAEARILLEAAAARAHSEELYASALRAENNLGVVLEASDRYAEVLERAEHTLALARRRGDRRWESTLRTGSLLELWLLGRWEEAFAIAAEEKPFAAGEFARAQLLDVARIHCERGELRAAEALIAGAGPLAESDNPQMRAGYATAEARLLRARGRPAEALAAAERALAIRGELSIVDTNIKTALVEAAEAALALPDLDEADRLLAIPQSLDPGELTPFLQANELRLRARLDAARGAHERVDEHFRAGAALCREFGLAFHQAVTQLEHAEWLVGRQRPDEADPLLSEARETLERLGAKPWLDRLDAARAGTRTRIPA